MGKRILVVDDEPKLLDAVDLFLKEAGYEVHTTDQSKDAARMALELQPDLMLLDLKMPGMDGYAVLDALKKDPRTRDLEVIIITAKVVAEQLLDDSQYALHLILPKPFSKQQLVTLVKQRLDAVKGHE